MIKNESECIFCKLLKDNENKTFIADFTYSRVLVNFSQTYYGRSIYIFKDHVKDMLEANTDDNIQFIKEILIISKVLKKVFIFDRLDIATLGNEVPHYHWHLIPRYISDSNYKQETPWLHKKR